MKKLRIISLLLVVMLFITMLPIQAEAATNGTGTTTSTEAVYSSMKSACNAIRSGMVARRNDAGSAAFDYYFTVKYKTTSYNSSTIYDQLRKEIFKETGKLYEGDYLLSGLYMTGLMAKASKSGSSYIVSVTAYGNYYITKAQSTKLTKWIDSNAKTIATKNGTSQYQKALAIYKWVTKNCTYGSTKLGGRDTYHTAYGAKYGKAQCLGIANLYYLMANAAGLDCRLVSSWNHAWNVVKIGSKWYIVDATFGLGLGDTRYLLLGSNNYSNWSSRNQRYSGGSVTVSKTNYK